ncbi:hypothetical protein L1887_47090 [Cichorium endivia]|nr:hypothetical protein L1887_47090 [Cichorium endivia]
MWLVWDEELVATVLCGITFTGAACTLIQPGRCLLILGVLLNLGLHAHTRDAGVEVDGDPGCFLSFEHRRLRSLKGAGDNKARLVTDRFASAPWHEMRQGFLVSERESWETKAGGASRLKLYTANERRNRSLASHQLLGRGRVAGHSRAGGLVVSAGLHVVLARGAVEVASMAAPRRRRRPLVTVVVVAVGRVPVAAAAGAWRARVPASATSTGGAGRPAWPARRRGAASPVVTRVGVAASVRVAAPRVAVGGGRSAVVGTAVVPRALATAALATAGRATRRGSAVSVVGAHLALVDAGSGVVRLVGGGKVDADAASVQVLAVERVDASASALDGAHGDEAESTRATGAGIVDDDDLFDRGDGVELVLEVGLDGADGEAEHAEHGGGVDVGGRGARLRRWRATTVGTRRRRGAVAVAAVIATVISAVVAPVAVVAVVATSAGRSRASTGRRRTAATGRAAAAHAAVATSRYGGGGGRARVRAASRRRLGPSVFVDVLVVRNGTAFHCDVQGFVRVHGGETMQKDSVDCEEGVVGRKEDRTRSDEHSQQTRDQHFLRGAARATVTCALLLLPPPT